MNLKAFSDRTDLPVQSLYIDHSDKNASLWDYFPRHVTKNEFLKPADCVETVFTTQKSVGLEDDHRGDVQLGIVTTVDV